MVDTNLREMMELAAKAAGYTVRWHEHWKCFVHDKPHFVGDIERHVWLPDTDDGDSARLRSALMLNAEWLPGAVRVVHKDGASRSELLSNYSGDRNAALRMATLKCAVEYARRMG